MKRTSVSSTEVVGAAALVGALDADGLIIASSELDSAGSATREATDGVWLMREGDEWALLTLHRVRHCKDPHEDHPDQGSSRSMGVVEPRNSDAGADDILIGPAILKPQPWRLTRATDASSP